MPPPGLQFYLRSRVTLTFDLLTPKLVVSCPYNGHLYSVHLFSRYRVHKVGNRRTDGRTDKSITLCLRCQSGLAGHENRNCSLRATRLQVYAVSSGGGVVVFVRIHLNHNTLKIPVQSLHTHKRYVLLKAMSNRTAISK